MIVYNLVTRSHRTSGASATGLSMSGPIPRNALDQKEDGNTGVWLYIVL